MKWCQVGLMVTLVVTVLTGCAGGEAPSAAESDESARGYTSDVLETSYPGALDVSSQLALGTMELEGTENAVTVEQAASLLPLWQALQGGVTAQAEVNAVLAQIERTMTPEQLEAIAAMQLTQDGLSAWAERSGLSLPFVGGGGMGGGQGLSDEERAAIRATVEAGGAPPGFPEGGEMPSEEERAAIQATMEAGGTPAGFPGGGEMPSEEERAAIRATMEAGGERPERGRPGAGGRGLLNVLLGPLIDLLSERAAE